MDRHDRRGFFGRLVGGVAALWGSKAAAPQPSQWSELKEIAGTLKPGWTRTQITMLKDAMPVEVLYSYRKSPPKDQSSESSYPPELYSWI